MSAIFTIITMPLLFLFALLMRYRKPLGRWVNRQSSSIRHHLKFLCTPQGIQDALARPYSGNWKPGKKWFRPPAESWPVN